MRHKSAQLVRFASENDAAGEALGRGEKSVLLFALANFDFSFARHHLFLFRLTCASTRAASIPLPMITVVGQGTVASNGDESASERAWAGRALAEMAATSTALKGGPAAKKAEQPDEDNEEDASLSALSDVAVGLAPAAQIVASSWAATKERSEKRKRSRATERERSEKFTCF